MIKKKKHQTWSWNAIKCQIWVKWVQLVDVTLQLSERWRAAARPHPPLSVRSWQISYFNIPTCSPTFIRIVSQIWVLIPTLPNHLWIFICLKFSTPMHRLANLHRIFNTNCGILFINTFLYLTHLDGADVWKHNFTAHGVLFECCTPVTSFVTVLTDFIFQNDIKTAFCAPYK